MDYPFQTTIFFYAVVDKVKYPGQTVIAGATKDEYNENLEEFFNTLAAKFDENNEPAFVTFEPRELGGAPRAAGPGGPLPNAPASIPNCPIHGVPLKEKQNRKNGTTFYSCSERTGSGYCNWKPNDQR